MVLTGYLTLDNGPMAVSETQEIRAPAGPPQAPPGRRATLSGLAPVHLIFWTSLAVFAGSSLIRNRTLFTTAQHPISDQAVNTLLVNRAIRFDQFVGNYSRVGFHHPGPALLYVLGWGQLLFRDVLHVVPDAYNGQVVGAIVYSAVLMALTLVSVYRLTGSRAATAVAFGVIFLFAAQNSVMGDVWFPFLYTPAFLLFLVAGAGVTAGRTRELPSFVVACGLLVHGHISFTMFVALTGALAAGGWLFVHRGDRRAELRAHRRATIGAAVALAVFALPIVVNTVVHYPGEWPAYLRYVRHAQRAPRTFGQILHFGSQYWRFGIPAAVTAVALVLALVLTVRERNAARRRVFIAWYAVAALQALLTYAYIARGVDALNRTNNYTIIFARAIPLAVVIAAAAQVWLFVADRAAPARGGAARRRGPWAVAVAVPVVISLLLSVEAATSPRMVSRREPDIHLPQLVAAVREAPARAGRPVEYVLDVHDAWTIGGGVAVESGWQHLAWCIRPDPRFRWALLFGGFNLCSAAPGRRWVVHVTLNDPDPPGGRVLYRTYLGRTLITTYTRIDGR